MMPLFAAAAVVPAAIMLLAGAWASWRETGPVLQSALLHLAAGVVFAVLAVEFIPELIGHHDRRDTLFGFALGAMLTLGLAIELAALGLAIPGLMKPAMLTPARAWLAVAAVAAAFPVSAFVSRALLHGVGEPMMVGVLAFGCAALLFLVTEELLTEAHELPERPWLTALFFAGFLVPLMLDLG